MAKPSNASILKSQVRQLKHSQKWRDNADRAQLWTRMVDLYRGKHYETEIDADRALVNMAFATKNVIAPSVAINNPKFTVNARKADSAATAIITEQVINYLWRTHRYQVEFRLAVDDFLNIGHGWCKVGYKKSKPKQIISIEDADVDSDEAEGVDDHDETAEGNVETENITSNLNDDRPFMERISPFDVFVDPDARHPREMKWIAQRTRRPLADVLVDKRYLAAARSKVGAKLKGEKQDDSSAAISSDTKPESTISYVDVFEYYDIRRGTVATFCAEFEEAFLIAPKPMPYAFGHPFVMLRNYEVTDTFYPMGELEAIEALQHELNATRTDQVNHRKRFQRKSLYNKDAFDADGIEALQSDEDNVLVPVNIQGAGLNSLTEAIGQMPQPGIPPDFYNMSDLISGDIDRISGVSDYMRGAQAEIRRTATEAAMIQDAQNARAADKLSNIEHSLADIGGRLVQLMQQYMTGEMAVRIVGMSAAPVWINFDADYIQGEFDYEVEAGSTQPRNESFRRSQALDLVDAMAPFIGAQVVNPMAVARHVLQFGFNIQDPDQFLVQQPQPMGAPTPEGEQDMPPQEGMPPEMAPPAGAPQMTTQAQAVESGIPGVPPEIFAQLAGQTGLG